MLIVRNEEDFAEKTTYTFTYAKLILFIVLSGLILFIGSLFLVSTLLEQWFDPRYAQAEANRQLVELSLTVDSLEVEVSRKGQFIEMFQRIVRGDSTTGTESEYLANADNRQVEAVSAAQTEVSDIDAQFRQEFEEHGLELLTVGSGTSASQLDDLILLFTLIGDHLSPLQYQG